MKKYILFLLALIFAGCSSTVSDRDALSDNVRKLQFTNNSDFARIDEAVQVPFSELAGMPGFSAANCIFSSGDVMLPSQIIDGDSDGKEDSFLLLLNFGAGETLTVSASCGIPVPPFDIPSRVQAELSVKEGGEFVDREYIGGQFKNIDYLEVPPEHTDHSFFIRYEGPGWESDKVGYRFYLDWRNAVDIFGKKTSDLVLQNVGQDGFDSYHEPSDWGMDILKVGESLGIGSIAMWTGDKAERVAETGQVTSQITANGPIEAGIRTVYPGWKIAGGTYNLVSDLSIQAGSRMTHAELNIDPQPENLCTGIVKHPGVNVITREFGSWSCLATYGPQSLAGDSLGMAVLYRTERLFEVTEDQNSHVIILTPENGSLDYYFLAAWQGETGGISNEKEFTAYLDLELKKLASPVK